MRITDLFIVENIFRRMRFTGRCSKAHGLSPRPRHENILVFGGRLDGSAVCAFTERSCG